MFLSAFAALRDPISRAYYARKISQANVTTKLSLHSRDDAVMSYSPGYETALFTAHRPQKVIDNNIGAPRRQGIALLLTTAY